MELVDQLLVILASLYRSGASNQLRAAGYFEDEVRGEWNFARAAGYIEPPGLGMDPLTPAGKDGPPGGRRVVFLRSPR